MDERRRFEILQQKYPHPHFPFFQRPHATRRQFFRSLAGGLSGFYLAGKFPESEARAAGVSPRATARQCIFLFMQGAPSGVDTFDFKMTPSTPADFAPETVNGLGFPVGLMPNTATILGKIAIVRSGLAWALAHPLAQTWFQIGRNPTSATGRIAPHIGSVVALEREKYRRPDQVFPAFIALNPRNLPGSGYFPVAYSPFKTVPTGMGLANTEHQPGEARFQSRWELLQARDGALRSPDSPLGKGAAGMAALYEDARNLVFNPTVTAAFSYTEEESLRYGGTSFGDACLLARKIVEADQGTSFIQVTLGGWDHHQGIYNRVEQAGNNAARNLYAQAGSELDPAFTALINDLEASGKLDETLIVLCGEFGRTVGAITPTRNGRDHYLQMFYVFAGGGVRGGKVIGETNETGAFTVDPGWSRFRDIRPEDVEATIYSALGIDWTTVRFDDPLGRGFPYVPLPDEDAYVPVDELFV